MTLNSLKLHLSYLYISDLKRLIGSLVKSCLEKQLKIVCLTVNVLLKMFEYITTCFL